MDFYRMHANNVTTALERCFKTFIVHYITVLKIIIKITININKTFPKDRFISVMLTDSKHCKTAILFRHSHKWENFIRKKYVTKELG